jgi:lipopolysaccharide transport system ATP-binding protein
MSTTAVKIEGLSKQFMLGRSKAPKTAHDAFAGLMNSTIERVSSPLGRRDSRAAKQGRLVWALQDVSFEIESGETVGIIGRNGAGKSTLLKILSRIMKPTGGSARTYGRIGSLLEVGTGFHPELSGRDNIFLNGTILGMKRAEIAKKFDDIVSFAEVDKYIDTPVKHYSSGMHVRLAFAVAAHLQADILIVDEVLAVGDVQFQKKCLDTMRNVVASGRTVLFVSHNLGAVRTLCSRGILLHKGKLICDSTVDACLSRYVQDNQYQSTYWERDASRAAEEPSGPLQIDSVAVDVQGTQPRHALDVEIALTSLTPHLPAFLSVDIHDAAGIVVMQALPTVEGFITAGSSRHTVRMAIELPPLIPDTYSVSVWAGSQLSQTYDEVAECVNFEIQQSPTKDRTSPHSTDHGWIVPNTELAYVADSA